MKLKLLTTLLLLFIFQYQIQAQVILDSDSSAHIATKELATIDNDTIKLQKLILLCENCYQQITSSQIKYQPNDRCLAYHAYGSKLLALAEKIGDVEGKIIGSFYKGLEMELRNKETEAEKLYLQWYELRKKEQIKTKNTLKLRWVYDYLSQFYMRTLQIEKTEKILKIWYSEVLKQKNKTWTHHHVARKLGYFYYQIGEYEKASNYYNLALDENAFPLNEYIEQIKSISLRLIYDGQIETAIRIDNNFLERLRKKDEQLFEIYLHDRILNLYNSNSNINYQLFFLQKFYKYVDTRYIKNPEDGLKLYKKFRNLYFPYLLSRSLVRKHVKNYLLYIDKNFVSSVARQQEYIELFNEISYCGLDSYDLLFETFWKEILPRIEKIQQDKIVIKQVFYNKIITTIQTHLIKSNKAEVLMLAIKNIEKLKNKAQKDESDKEFLIAIEKELNFVRKIKGYNFWGR
jgi:tetratricopeptide (TPR) repeat protein